MEAINQTPIGLGCVLRYFAGKHLMVQAMDGLKFVFSGSLPVVYDLHSISPGMSCQCNTNTGCDELPECRSQRG